MLQPHEMKEAGLLKGLALAIVAFVRPHAALSVYGSQWLRKQIAVD
jgi:hypothetical protein